MISARSYIGLLLLVFVSFIGLQAQETATVKGIVNTHEGKAAIVSVVVEENQRYYTNSNDKGEYEIKVPAGNEITLVFFAKHFGFPQKNFTATKRINAVEH
ncbi:MAG TPA: hypothetical protein PL084_13885 [Chitinophagales bacterium]|nr:hypothetical protein [Chitinophagales bacterium]